MKQIVYVNGEFVPKNQAKISIFDRGFLFADAVYEVCAILDGKLVDNEAHIQRLHRSLDALDMTSPSSDKEITEIQQALIEQNQVNEGLIYLQITRGSADRDFFYPEGATPSLVMFTQSNHFLNSEKATKGISVISVNDIRWQRRDIKTTSLLAASMAKMEAKKAGADDVWMIENGFITEGSSSNAFIITQDDCLITRPASHEILKGITRTAILSMVDNTNLTLEERPFTLEEAYQAKEAFSTSASTFILPVIKIDNHVIANGEVGTYTLALRKLYIQIARDKAL